MLGFHSISEAPVSTLTPADITAGLMIINTTMFDVLTNQQIRVYVDLALVEVVLLPVNVVLIDDGGKDWWDQCLKVSSWDDQAINTNTWSDIQTQTNNWSDADVDVTGSKPSNCNN